MCQPVFGVGFHLQGYGKKLGAIGGRNRGKIGKMFDFFWGAGPCKNPLLKKVVRNSYLKEFFDFGKK
jgi:hypothetical protein